MNPPTLPTTLTVDLVLVALNFALCIRVVWVNTREAKRGFREYAWLNYWRSGFAAFYATSYAILTFGMVDRLRWSHVMIGVSPVVWEIVWVRPALTGRRVRRALTDPAVANINDRRNAAA